MNILFLTVSRIDDINAKGLYTDLMREFISRGNQIYIASPVERRFGKKTYLIKSDNYQILKIKTLNIQKTNVIEKGIGTILLEYQYERAIRKYWGDVKFDLVLSATPPITFNNVIENIKKRYGCRSYLMLKDIFPQNAVDLGMMMEGGLLHRIFRRKEEQLYKISDKIGCMSPANCKYVLEHNPSIDPSKIELCPNAITPTEMYPLKEADKKDVLSKLGIPVNKTVFIYGGNLGKPQGLSFLLKVLEANEERTDSFIVVIGNGTEFPKMEKWFETNKPQNSKLFSAFPQSKFDELVNACDVGLIFLDPRFTIPNFPSRLLSYLEYSIPVLLATDRNTDMGEIAERERFGFWSESGDLKTFLQNMDKFTKNSSDQKAMGRKGYEFLLKTYTTDKVADTILS